MFTCTSSKGPRFWFVIAGFRSVLFVSCFKGCLSFIKIRGVPPDKNIPEILVGNFRSVITVPVVYHLPKFSDCRAALDWILVTTSKLRTKHKKLVNGKRISIRNVPTRKTGLLFQNFCFSREFSSGMNKKNCYCHLHQQEFPGICGKW